MKVLVTYCAGYIGSLFTRAVLEFQHDVYDWRKPD
jgi:UDP-glucose 4-epimerase